MAMRRWVQALAAAACLLWLPGTAGSGIFDQVTLRRLQNGMPVILMENHKAPVVTFQIWYRTGSRNDPWGRTGLAHVFEHMMFKGTREISGAEFSRLIQENGAQYNAFTGHDYTAYYATLSAERAPLIMRLEADRMQNLVLSEADFATERRVVMEERRLRVEDNPQALLSETLNATAFQATPYHWPVIGWMGDLERLTLEDVRRYYRTYYHPGNAFIVAVGDFNTDEFMGKISEVFGAIPAGAKPPHDDYQEPPQRGERIVHVQANARQPALQMGFHVPNIGHPDAFVLEVIAALLSGGKSARLYAELVREKELALSADADNSLLSDDSRLFYLSAVPMRGKGVEELQDALLEQLERLKKEPVGEEELRKAKTQLETGFVFSQDSLFYQAMLLARYEIVAGWERIKEYLPAVRKVTDEDVRRVAATYFVPENRTLGILHPVQPGAGAADPDKTGP